MLKTRLCFGLIALAVMTGCVKRPPPVDFEKEFPDEKAKYAPNIGKTYWLLGIRSLCPTSTTNVIDCTSLPPGTKLQTDGIEARGVTERYVYGKSRFILLHNAIVTSVQVSGRLR